MGKQAELIIENLSCWT